ncbi:glycosyltransferase family 4 protein [Halorubrum sp. T3]|uniref:glycosyltransferase family 4 protein n=1 Tax=Halorubrum sp. T3 TaxID=1194088 RepID=UPI0009E3FAEA|nr:glycosyltransferase family 4 protein [Halorubrum sp. T3]
MSTNIRTVGVLGGRDPRGFGGVESVVSNIASHASSSYEFIQYCSGDETTVEESDIGTIRKYSNGFGGVRSKHVSSCRAARDLSSRDVDLVHGHGDNVLGLAAFPPSEPYVVTFHGTTAGMYANVYGDNLVRKVLSQIRPLPERIAARQCDIAVACSEQVRDELTSYYGIDREKTVVIQNGVDTDRFVPVPQSEARSRLGLDSDQEYVLWIGSDPQRKDLQTAIQAVELMERSVKLLVVGTDGENTSNVEYLGRVPDKRMADLYSSADVQCLSSLYEGFPLVLFESLACGTPVVASPYMPRVESGVSYVPTHDAINYAQTIENVLTNPTGVEELRAFVVEYDWNHVAERYADIYDQII